MRHRKIIPATAVIIVTATIEMRMQSRIIPPEATIVIMTATHSMNVVMPQMRQPAAAFVEVTATNAVPMPYRKGNPCASGKMVPAAGSMAVGARIVVPTTTVVMVTATRSMNMLMLQIEMSDSCRTSTIPMFRAMLNLRSNGRSLWRHDRILWRHGRSLWRHDRGLRRYNRGLRLNAVPGAWTIIRYTRYERISLNLTALR